MNLARLWRSQAAGGALLAAACVAALAWSNSPAAPAYFHLLGLHLGTPRFGLSLHAMINDGLMTFFFLLASLEIRREMTQGRLASRRGIAAPGVAALGGMAVPAAIYLAVAHGHPAALRGWAVPVATDIAFSLAVLMALGPRVPPGVRVFLTALAILDDLGAILVIGLFYNRGLAWPSLLGAAGVLIGLIICRRARMEAVWPYTVGGLLLWLLVFNSGVHATLAGVALAFTVPTPTASRLERGLQRWVGLAVLPVFGLANAGLDLRGVRLSAMLSPAPLGTMLGLLLGKPLGVFGAALAGRYARIAQLPEGVGTANLFGASLLCGIGFTMSLFIGDLAFRDDAIYPDVKLGILGASLVAAACGSVVLGLARK